MPDQTQNQSSEETKVFEKMPSIAEFLELDAETQKTLIEKFGNTQDQDEEESETSNTETDSSEEEQTESTDESKETEKENPDEEAEDKTHVSAKQYKELQAEFTRRSQLIPQLKKEIEELKAALGKKGEVTEQKSPLAKLVENNPNAKDLVEAIEAEVDFRLKQGLEKGIKPLQDRMAQSTAEENYGNFKTEVSEFLASPLGKLEAEFNAVAAELYENQEALLEAASKDPALFKNLKKEVLSRHFVKAAKLMGETVTAEDKNKKVKDTGVSGKSKTTTTVDDELDMKIFKGKTSDEMKAILSKHGAVKNS